MIDKIWFRCPKSHGSEKNMFMYPKSMEKELTVGKELMCRHHAQIEKDKLDTKSSKIQDRFIDNLRNISQTKGRID